MYLSIKTRNLLFRLFFLANIFIVTNAGINSASNEIKIKQMIERSGCQFVSAAQFLSRDVCILPGYQANEIPSNKNTANKIVVNLFSAVILEINERENRLPC